jgi:AraC family transcriptional regulator
MKSEFRTIRDYHLSARRIHVEARDWRSLRASILIEDSNDVAFAAPVSNGIVMTVDGTARHLTRMDGIDDETPSRPGEICLIPAGLEVHLAWQNHALLQESFMLEFDEALFATYAPEVVTEKFSEGHLVPANFARRPELESLTRIIAREVSSERGRGRIFAEAAIRLLAIEIAFSAWSTPARPLAGRVGHDARVHRAIEFIEAHFTRDISLLEISAAANLSPTHLTEVFSRHTGTTPYSYVVDRRLTYAVHLLRVTDLPISHVALEAGFADQQHLTRMLRARHNRTPKQVRQAG